MREQIAQMFSVAVDAAHLEQALTHPSYANEKRLGGDNQRLEFLGDAVLDLCVSEVLWERFPDADEGELTRMRAQLVNTEALAVWGREHGVAEALLLGKGAEGNGLRTSTSVLADAVEALIAAAYLEGGLEAARKACHLIMDPQLSQFASGTVLDAKTELQELVQGRGSVAPRYELLDSWGPAHERWFKVKVLIAGHCLGEGLGRSKRAAEREAAQVALKAIMAGAADQAVALAAETGSAATEAKS